MSRYLYLRSSYSITNYSNFCASAFINSFSFLSMAFNLTNPSLASFPLSRLLSIILQAPHCPSFHYQLLPLRVIGTPCVSISFAPDCHSFKPSPHFSRILNILKKNPLTPLPLHLTLVALSTNPSSIFKDTSVPNARTYFIWELGAFAEGSKVILGDELVLVKITRVVGVGDNLLSLE